MHDIAHAAADAARVPAFDDVLAQGRRRRDRRRGLAAGAAAAAVAAIVGVTQVVGGPSGPAEPQPAVPSEPPSGSDPTVIPYWLDGELHVGSATIPTELDQVFYAEGTTVVAAARVEGPSDYRLVDGEGLVRIYLSERLALAQMSRDGRVLVLLDHVSDDMRRLLAWDLERHTKIASVDVPVDVQCCDAAGELEFVGIDNQHRVFLTDGRTVRMWVPGGDLIEVRGVDPTTLIARPWPGGLAHQGTGSPSDPAGAFGTVDDDGVFHQVGTTSNDQVGTWSPDGEVYASYGVEQADGQIGIEYADGRPPETLDLPSGEFWVPVAWESETQLVLRVVGEHGDAVVSPTEDLARCDVEALVCRRITDVPSGPVLWAADAGG